MYNQRDIVLIPISNSLILIHPFDDGNSHGARLLMNLILIKQRYVTAII